MSGDHAAQSSQQGAVREASIYVRIYSGLSWMNSKYDNSNIPGSIDVLSSKMQDELSNTPVLV
jgi:hypothetical protein